MDDTRVINSITGKKQLVRSFKSNDTSIDNLTGLTFFTGYEEESILDWA